MRLWLSIRLWLATVGCRLLPARLLARRDRAATVRLAVWFWAAAYGLEERLGGRA